ncbi:MAG: hypothetical protein EXS13_08310, partial [Planctomycetes bacterium]|nr:hypothetical protein [Planctomycetota bacterium]
MSDDDELRQLALECIDRIEREGSAAFAVICQQHPQHADELRRRLGPLLRTGLLEGATPPSAPPQRLGDFVLGEKLGEGGMGVVYRAEQQSLRRSVALKLMRTEQLHFDGARERFRREIDAIARLQHHGIVPIHAVGEEAGLPYFAMELIDGKSVAQLLREVADTRPDRLTGASFAQALGHHQGSPLPAPFRGSWSDACIELARQVAEALAHAHERGVLHRDVKPGNVMVTRDGRAMLVDFGLAAASGAGDLTRTGALLGSLPYLSPEQVRGDSSRVGPRSDVYSLGITLFEMLALRVPYAESGVEATLRAIELGRPAPLRALNRAVPSDVETACLAAIDPDPVRRYSDAAAFAHDLDNLLHHRPIAARRPGPLLRARRFAQRRPALAVGVLLGSAIAIGGPWLVAAAESRQRKIEHDAKERLAHALERSESMRLLAEANALAEEDPTLALLLGIEGAAVAPGPVANDALLEALRHLREVRRLTPTDLASHHAAFSPDSRRLALGCEDASVRLFDAGSGQELARLHGHDGAIRSAAWDRAGETLLTAANDGSARLWNTADGTLHRVLRHGSEPLSGARFDPSDRRVVTFGNDGIAMVWATRSGAVISRHATRGPLH